MKVCWVLGGDESDLKEITLLNRVVPQGQTMKCWPSLEWEADPRHVENNHGKARADQWLNTEVVGELNPTMLHLNLRGQSISNLDDPCDTGR